MTDPMLIDVLVVGGGLAGMVVCQGLHQSNADWRLLEARPILGGRLANDDAFDQIDLGGAWIWPEDQPRIHKLAKSLDLQTFAQPGDPQSTRIQGGAVQFIRKIARQLPASRIQLQCPVKSCSRQRMDNGEEYVRVETHEGEIFCSRRVVLAFPPALLSHRLSFEPPLSERKRSAISQSRTWMAGVTKTALVYPHRFWNPASANAGLPRQENRPAFQVYDSSTVDNGLSAFTFFALVPPLSPAAKSDELLAKQVAEQIREEWKYAGLNYADKALSYTSYHIQRWPHERYISDDDKPDRLHPHQGPSIALAQPEWDGLLEFAGSETDLRHPGFMEGAVGAAHRVLESLESFLTEKAQKNPADSKR